ncbi:hypothetical protein, partial [Mesorhizobium sp. M8A.F.Ca.ET.207.01.1.1]|uniref:hypothetical protein n=1 Tax=Mesorhizobium sp. M8A.F.Ca.ET.207.01.1.1 TaxID=2563968 RepID=UPI001AEE3002
MRLAGSLATESHIRAMWLLAASLVTKNTAVMPVPSSTTYSRRLSHLYRRRSTCCWRVRSKRMLLIPIQM